MILLKRKIKRFKPLFILKKIFPIVCFSSLAITQSLDIGMHVFENKNIPFWFESNKKGMFENGSFFSARFNHRSSNFDYGVEVVKAKNYKPFLTQLFVKKNMNDYLVKFGMGGSHISYNLSSGSLVESSNAIPIPKVSIETSSYRIIKLFNNNYLYNVSFAHGWLSNSAYIENPFVHEKSLKIRKPFSDDNFLNFELNHMVIWGGETKEYGPQPSSFQDFFKVIFALPGGNNSIQQEQENSLGNHLGSWKITYKNKYFEAYFEHPFEDESGARWLLNEFDGLYGININQGKLSRFPNITYEYINTMDQSGSEGASDSTYGWDNYYNHYIYRSGWTNKGRVIGSPLLTIGSNKGRYSEHRYIINNRIKAHHFGFKGEIFDKLHYKIFFTYSENFGTFPDEDYFKSLDKIYAFEGGLKQKSGLIELMIKNIFSNVDLLLGYGFDDGELLNKTDSFMLKINHKFVF